MIIGLCSDWDSVTFRTLACGFMRFLQTYGQFCRILGGVRGLSLRKARPLSILGEEKVHDIRTFHIRWGIRKDAPGIAIADALSIPQRPPAHSRGPYDAATRTLFGNTVPAISAAEVAAGWIRASPIRLKTNGRMARLFPNASIISKYRRRKRFVRR